MAGTKRTPISRPAVTAIPDAAVHIWRKMRRLKCTCEAPIAGSTKTPTHDECQPCAKWYDLLGDLAKLIPHKPWHHPLLLPISLEPEYDYERKLYTGRMAREREPEPRMIELENALRAADRELRKRARARLASSTTPAAELPTST